MVRTRHPIRFYDADGVRLPSVTSVLSRTDPIFNPSKEEGLQWWRDHEPKHEEITKEACRRGSIIHSEIELALTGRQSVEYSIDEWVELGIPDYMNYLLDFVRQVNQSKAEGYGVHVEKVVKHNAGYAGTADLICTLDEVPTIVDWKSTRHHKDVGEKTKSKAHYKNAEMQIAAYAAAYNQQEKPEEPIQQGLIVIAYSWREPDVIRLNQDKLATRIGQFAERLSAFQVLENGE